MSKKVAVLMGGCSPERKVSLSSGKNVVNALTLAGYEVFSMDLSHDLRPFVQTLSKEKPDVVFNALHGQFGEDGCVQGVLDLLQIPYTHSGRMASALAMDKVMAKKIYHMAGLPVALEKIVTAQEVMTGHVLSVPYVLKPICNGSSVGVHIFQTLEGNGPFEGKKCPYKNDERLMAEEFIPGRELTVAVMDNKPLGVLEIIPHDKFYTYKAKYSQGGSQHIVPADLPKTDYDEAMRIALVAHEVLGCRGISRSDLRYDDTDKTKPARLVILETNTQPGMTSLSLVPEIAKNAGYSYVELVAWMVENARCGD